jgi:SAM-dependent methyltransferase
MVEADGLECAAGHCLVRRDGYFDASAATEDETTQRTFASFGYEWTTFDAVNDEDREFWERYVEDVPFADLAGALALDAGCGKGRYTRFTAERVGAMVALDGSVAAAAAAKNLGDLENLVVFRSDLRQPPFAEDSFELVTCLGVLHHLEQPEEGFRSLVRLLAPGGVLLVYLYSRPSGRSLRSLMLSAAGAVRKLTVRIPHRSLRVAAWPLAVVLYAAFVVPGDVGVKWHVSPLKRFPLNAYRGKPVRALWLDTFDRLSAPVEFRYRWDDVAPWYEDAGLEIINVREWGGLMITARRP